MLLTPGPLTTSRTVKAAMLEDWGSRDARFLALTTAVRHKLLELAGGGPDHTTVLLQGSGTYAIEAALGTLVPARDGKVLVLENGAYGRRIRTILARLGRSYVVCSTPEDTFVDPATVAAHLAGDAAITHVAIVHCETSSGLLNPLAEIAQIVAAAGRRLIVDAMSSFGALPIDAGSFALEALIASANKCLEGVPGIAFVIARRTALQAAAGNASSLSLDLHDQWRAFEATGEWRFTPPTHVMAALQQALNEHAGEGGVAGRGARYQRNCRKLIDGMQTLGFETFLPTDRQAPIIVTFRMPADHRFNFEIFYRQMAARGFLIYPGKLTEVPSFRIGCIGRVDETNLRAVVGAVRASLTDMGVISGTPVAPV